MRKGQPENQPERVKMGTSGVLYIRVANIESLVDFGCLISADRRGRRCAAIVAHNPVCPGCGGLFCQVLAENARLVTRESRLRSGNFELGKQEVHSDEGKTAGFDDDDRGRRDFRSFFVPPGWPRLAGVGLIVLGCLVVLPLKVCPGTDDQSH